MTATEVPQTPSFQLDAIGATIERLRSTVRSGESRTFEWRDRQLDGIARFCKENTKQLTKAMAEDLGRPELEAWIADIGPSISEAEYLKKNYRKWAAPRKVSVSLAVQPARAEVLPEPLGVALVIAPWNYPVNLVLEPMAAAFAAGNTVVLKPSEVSPATSGFIASRLPDYVDTNALAIYEGGVDVSTALLAERFDHIFFTGSTNVGKVVMRAAAEHLTPVLLELGGKSPVIVADDVDIEVAASRIAWGKGLNAGQTCIAPDYVLVRRERRDALVAGIERAWTDFYGKNPRKSRDFGRIVSGRHHRRLVSLLNDQTVAVGGDHDENSRYLAPTIVIDPELDSPLMTEEIFGPILPVVGVDDLDDAVDFVNERPKPLALYVFSDDAAVSDLVLRRTSSGGACVNHTLMHFSPHDLPFGGVGPAGMGRYHGKAGFDAFSNLKGVLKKPTKGETNLLYPPYGRVTSKLIKKFT